MQEFKAYAASRPSGPLEPFTFDPGPLRPEEVEIKVTHCGLCHSDLSMLDNECVGAILKPMEIPAFGLIMGQKSVTGSPTGSPTAIDRMLAFCARHSVAPMVEFFPISKVNGALDHLRSGKARYRVVLVNDFGKTPSAAVSRPEEEPTAVLTAV